MIEFAREFARETNRLGLLRDFLCEVSVKQPELDGSADSDVLLDRGIAHKRNSLVAVRLLKSAQAISSGASHTQFPSKGAWVLRCPGENGVLTSHDGVFLSNNVFSGDGISFSSFANPSFKHWQNGTGYGGGVFVKTGAAGQIFTSTDGTTWTNRDPGGEDITAICYGDGVFVVRKFWTTGSLWVSTDLGSSWWTVDTGSTPDRFSYNHIVFGKGKFIFPIDNRVRTSSDGLSWKEYKVPNVPPGFELRIANQFDGSFFVGAAETSRSGSSVTIVTGLSQDGISWSFSTALITSKSSGKFREAGCGGGFIMIVSESDPAEVWLSRNYGATWASVDGPWGAPGNTSAFFAANGGTTLAVSTGLGVYSAHLHKL
jgi:hypothetical protein